MADRIIFVLTLILAGLYFYATAQIPSLEIGDPLGPKAFPRLLGVGLLLTAGLLLWEILKARQKRVEGQPAESAVFSKSDVLVVGGVAVWTGLYFVAFEPLGFVIATVAYLMLLTNYFNRGKWMANVLTSVLFPIITYVLFTKGLGVSLARGVLPV
jgi:putative tricarboxylic transport membrane protein